MKRSNSIKTDKILVIFISLSLIFVFYLFNKTNIKKLYLGDSNVPKVIRRKDIKDIISDYKSLYDYVETNDINNSLTSILVNDESGTTKCFVYDSKGKEYTLKDLIKEDKYEDFNKKVLELLSLKYAAFIVDGIKVFPGDISYHFKDNELIIYYQNFVFNPAYNKEINLHVNYNEIDEYLTFKHTLDKEYKNEDGYAYDPSKQTIAISFDDGPNNKNTLTVLKTLEDNKMSATFFMVGNKMYNQKDILKTVYASHSEIGSHTYSHINMKRTKADKIKDEIDKTSRIFKDITGADIRLIRPPYGAYTNDIIKDYNYSFILWNADTDDWKDKNTERIVNYILDHADDGNIILMHDTYATTVEAVKIVLPQLYAKGIQVVSVSKLAEMKNKTLEVGTAYRSFK